MKDHFDHDSLEVLRDRISGPDVHNIEVTATARLCEPEMARPLRATREFSALRQRLPELTGWLLEHSVCAAAMEGTGIFWKAPYPKFAADHAHRVQEGQPVRVDVGLQGGLVH